MKTILIACCYCTNTTTLDGVLICTKTGEIIDNINDNSPKTWDHDSSCPMYNYEGYSYTE